MTILAKRIVWKFRRRAIGMTTTAVSYDRIFAKKPTVSGDLDAKRFTSQT